MWSEYFQNSYRVNASLPDGVLMEYVTQASAFAATKQLPTFARETWYHDKKKKQGEAMAYRYYRASYMEFYASCIERFAPYYELIREELPCSLFFDIECIKRSEDTFDDLLRLETTALEAMSKFALEQIPRRTVINTIVLDASNSEKFSRHWILHLDRCLFANNYETVLQWVHAFLEWFKSHDEKSAEKLTDLLDLSVYSKNRLFRMLHCAKVKSPQRYLRCVRRVGTFEYDDDDTRNVCTWLRSLVQIRCDDPTIDLTVSLSGSKTKLPSHSSCATTVKSGGNWRVLDNVSQDLKRELIALLREHYYTNYSTTGNFDVTLRRCEETAAKILIVPTLLYCPLHEREHNTHGASYIIFDCDARIARAYCYKRRHHVKENGHVFALLQPDVCARFAAL